MPGLVQHACFGCRKVCNKPYSEQSGTEYPCPNCAQLLHVMGTAFRAPKRSDESQWRKVEELSRAGIWFVLNGGRKPQVLQEVAQFLEARAKAKQSRGERILARIGKPARAVTPKDQCRLHELQIGGNRKFALAGRELKPWMTVMFRDGDEWCAGTFRGTDNGGNLVEPHLQIWGGKILIIGAQTVLRWPES